MNIKRILQEKMGMIIFSLIGIIGLISLKYLDQSGACFHYPADGWLPQSKCKVSANFLAIFPFILLGSILIDKYKKEKIYRKWKYFTFIYLGFYLIVYLLTPTSPPDFSPIHKGVTSFALIFLYILITVIFYRKSSTV